MRLLRSPHRLLLAGLGRLTRLGQLVAVAALVSTNAATAGCAGSGDGTRRAGNAGSRAPAAVHLINPVGPTVIPVAGISSGAVKGPVDITVQHWKTIDEAVGLLSGDSAEFAVLPVTTAANFSASGIDLELLAVHEWKVFYLVAASASAFTGWGSLVGKKVYSPEGKGQTVDVLTRYALRREHIEPDKQVSFAYAPAQEIVTLFQSGKIEYAALPEPFVTQALAKGNGKVALDYQTYWSQAGGRRDGIPVAGLFVKRSYAKGHRQVVTDLAKTFTESVRWGNDHPDAAIQASATVLPLPAAVFKQALGRIQFRYVPAADARQDVLDFLNAMRQTYPEGVKKIPSDDFFR